MENQQKTQKSVVQPVVQSADSVSEYSPVKQQKKSSAVSSLAMMLLVAVVVLAGVATGYQLAVGGSVASLSPVSSDSQGQKTNEKKVGSLERDVKYDEVEGKLVEGGIGSEGTHHLERIGGESQNVYLTSSTVDLGSYVGKMVKVWGITFAAQKAGWLMDVAQLEEQ